MILFFLLACIKHVEPQYEIEYPCDIMEGENIMGGIVDQVDNGIVAVSFGVERIEYFKCNDVLRYIGRGPDYEALQ